MLTRSDRNRTALRSERLATAYLDAKEYVIAAGFAEEIDWQSEVTLEETTEAGFLREAAWVVLSSGFRESTVRRFFPRVSSAFFDWVDATAIALRIDECREAALQAFANRRKIDAIATIVIQVAEAGIECIKAQIHDRGTEFLQELPFVGPVTALHLAKNLGAPVAKPDRHLLRVTEAAGYESPQQLCLDISDWIGDSVAVVDLVLWRYATLSRDHASAISVR